MQIKDRIKNNIQPSTLGLFDVIVETIDDKDVIKVVISSGTEKPYYLRKKGRTPEGCYIRVGSSKERMTERMIDDMYARRIKNTLKEIDILNQIPISYNSDISFYINKNLFDLPNINNFALFNILQYFKKDIYGAIKLKEDNIKLNIFIDYKKDDIDILTLYTLKGLNNIPIKIFNYNNSVIKNAIVKSNYINIDIDLK